MAVCAGMGAWQNAHGLGLDRMSKVTNSFPVWLLEKVVPPRRERERGNWFGRAIDKFSFSLIGSAFFERTKKCSELISN